MRRLWIGVALLVVLLIFGLWTAFVMDSIHQPIGTLLEQAASAALQNDWPLASELCQEAKSQWERRWFITAAVADHTPMDEIDGLFARLPILSEERETADFAATCAQLAKLTQAMGNAHSLSWWNLL